MIKISIVCVGKIKEKFFRDAIDEYSKRLSRYSKLNIIEVADEMTPMEQAPFGKIRSVKKRESAFLQSYPRMP